MKGISSEIKGKATWNVISQPRICGTPKILLPPTKCFAALFCIKLTQIFLCIMKVLPLTPQRLTKGPDTRGNSGAATQWRTKRSLSSDMCYHGSAGLWFSEAEEHHQPSPLLINCSPIEDTSWLQVLSKTKLDRILNAGKSVWIKLFTETTEIPPNDLIRHYSIFELFHYYLFFLFFSS